MRGNIPGHGRATLARNKATIRPVYRRPEGPECNASFAQNTRAGGRPSTQDDAPPGYARSIKAGNWVEEIFGG